MGFLDFFRALKNARKVGGNFGYIAQNIATIYFVLKESDFGKRLSKDQLLFATALCDTISYVKLGTITIEDLHEAVILSQIGEVRIFPYSVRHDSLSNFLENKDIVGLAMQIEALIFSAEMIVDYHDVVDSVVSQKNQIEQMINKTLKEGKNCELYPAVFFNISDWLNDNNFRQTILDFDVNAL